MTTQTNDRVYRKLLYYFESGKKVYFKVTQNKQILFRVGLILDLNQSKSFVILRENVLGEIPVLFEDIIEDTINLAEVRK